MRKYARNKAGNQAQRATGQRTLWLARYVRRNLYEFVITEGMKALDTVLESERTELCGPAFGKGQPGDPVRWGRSDGRLVSMGA